MPEFKAIKNQGEYISDHYLGEILKSDLGGIRKLWRAAQSKQRPNSAQGLRTFGPAHQKAKQEITEKLASLDPRRDGQVRAHHDRLLAALAYPPPAIPADQNEAPRQHVTVIERGTSREITTALAVSDENGLNLVAIDASWCETLEDLITDDGGARLLNPIRLDGSNALAAPLKAVDLIFASDHAPRYVLLLAGGVVLLADSTAWFERRYLALELDGLLARKDDTAGGELETAAALFGAEAVLTRDESSIGTGLQGLVEAGRKHAVGVSATLREGLRQSVEWIAQEILDRIVEQGGDPGELGDELPRELTRQSLRYLYRILFLLYAEARPELGILPSNDEAYQNGYGLARLGELVSYELPEEARDRYHYYESLDLLFRLVDNGHNATAAATDGTQPQQDTDQQLGLDLGLSFEPLRSNLFAANATPLLAQERRVGAATVDTRLRNHVLHRVLEALMLTRSEDRRNRSAGGRGFVSYAQLGINQLGAVYEGLMSYTGFFAAEDLFEVAKDGDPAKGTWVLSREQADSGDYPEDVFVHEVNPVNGKEQRKQHPKGSFVYRLSGRERQRSASYYTPEVLTEFTVRHALAELLGEDESETNPPKLSARQILDITVCEPALGSGAFLNETISQLAATYMRRRSQEPGGPELPTADTYDAELQRVKAYIALHNCYGVDLNETAVELAEVSLWLNAMHHGLQAPWFGLHLRRGNSLIGARRAVYHKDKLKKKAWLATPPADRPLDPSAEAHRVSGDEIHHFLLPAAGWGSVSSTDAYKEYRGLSAEADEEREAIRSWRSSVLTSLSATQAKRMLALAGRVERLWELAQKRLTMSEREVRRHIEVWGISESENPLPEASGAVSREQVEAALANIESPLQRLELVMNAWCALWFWPVGQPGTPAPPDLAEWLGFLEAALGLPYPKPRKPKQAGPDLFETLERPFEQLAEEDHDDRLFSRCAPRLKIQEDYPWLAVVAQITRDEGFFHWELRFAQVFARGGFDLQVGNPPWVRPDWNDALTLAEFDPYFGLNEDMEQGQIEARRAENLSREKTLRAYLSEVSSGTGLSGHLSSAVDHPLLVGMQTNLYMNFIEQAWRNSSELGIVGLIHPDKHFTFVKGGNLRGAAYRRLRRHFQFRNELRLFEEIGHSREYGVSIYGIPSEISFVKLAWIYHPTTADESLAGKAGEALPGVKNLYGEWDTAPHPSRVVNVDEAVLAAWRDLVDDRSVPVAQARAMSPVSEPDNDALKIVANFPERLNSHSYRWSPGLHEKAAKESAIIEKRTAVPASLGEAILQGPSFTTLNAFARKIKEDGKSTGEGSLWDLVSLPEYVIPRTGLQRLAPRDRFELEQTKKSDGVYLPDQWRVAWRRRADLAIARAFHVALLPPGPTHIHQVHTLALPTNRQTVVVAGFWSSILADYLVRVAGKADVQIEFAEKIPITMRHRLTAPLVERALQLSCLTRDYAGLWEELMGTPWSMDTPLRTDRDRRRALVEIDALVGLMLGLSAEQLCALYASQFGVVRKNEWEMFFHPDGHRIGASASNKGVRQTEGETKIVAAWAKAELEILKGKEATPVAVPPDWIKPDREAEMTAAYRMFQARLASDAYPSIPEGA